MVRHGHESRPGVKRPVRRDTETDGVEERGDGEHAIDARERVRAFLLQHVRHARAVGQHHGLGQAAGCRSNRAGVPGRRTGRGGHPAAHRRCPTDPRTAWRPRQARRSHDLRTAARSRGSCPSRRQERRHRDQNTGISVGKLSSDLDGRAERADARDDAASGHDSVGRNQPLGQVRASSATTSPRRTPRAANPAATRRTPSASSP
jgi:hypothetical protein